MESGSVEVEDNVFKQALDQANKEFEDLYRHKMPYIKRVEDRVVAAKMVMMRAKDITREINYGKGGNLQFTFTVSAYDPTNQKWDRCPGCGDPDINQQSSAGKPWQGCFECRILLGSKGIIKAMDPTKGR